MIESCDIRQAMGSGLSRLVAGQNVGITNKLKRFRQLGYTRIEVSILTSTLFSLELYKEALDRLTMIDLAGCPTYKVSLQDQWNLIVDKLTQVVAVYVRNTRTFAYCHWWNSLTKRKQGVSSDNVSTELLECILANYSFNDRITHCFHIETDNKSYSILKHDRYKRVDGSTAMTLVPGSKNALFPSRSRLVKENVMFKEVGMDIYKNIYIEWPTTRFDKERKPRLAELIRINDSCEDSGRFDMSKMQNTLPSDRNLLIRLDGIKSSVSKPDYKALEANVIYTVTKYGYGLYRGKNYLHLVFENELMIRCCDDLRLCMEKKLEGVSFKFQVISITSSKGNKRIKCNIIE
jgi:hypothetical protein